MVLRKGHRIDIIAVHKAHERELRTCEELLDNDLALAELIVKKHVLECLLRLFKSLRNDNSLARSKSVIFENYRE